MRSARRLLSLLILVVGFVLGRVLAAAALGVTVTGCGIPPSQIAGAVAGPACSLVTVLSGEQIAGVVCNGFAEALRAVLARTAGAAGPASCRLVPLYDGDTQNFICEGLREELRQEIARRSVKGSAK